ncbi:MAG: alpha/beta fold hydrolase [Chitinophagales bacterium]|nr:alpha/beta fold hydrolase [Chitinophagales bacterium]
MILNYKVSGSGFPVVILHGFLGSLDNWQSIANQLSTYFTTYTFDLRNHGRSGHTDSNSYEDMSNDVAETIQQLGIEKLHLIGHSMGGKVAMRFALDFPHLVEKLVVVDISPRKYNRHHDSVFEAMFAVDLKAIHSRGEAEIQMSKVIDDKPTKQLLLKSLERQPDGSYEWKMNLDVLYEQYEEIVKPIEADHAVPIETLIIKGGKSRYINENDLPLFSALFPKNQLVTIPEAGHWVHAEAPREFLEASLAFLQS